MLVLECPPVVDRGTYTTAATAKLLGVHRNTIANYVKRKLLKPETSILDGRPRFRGKEIERFWKFATSTRKRKKV